MLLRKILCLILISSLFSCVEKNNDRYIAIFNNKENTVKINVDLWEDNGLISLTEEFSKDSIVKIEKYSFQRKSKHIILSNEFNDSVFKLLLSKKNNQEIIISSITNSKDSLLFGYKLRNLVLHRK